MKRDHHFLVRLRHHGVWKYTLICAGLLACLAFSPLLLQQNELHFGPLNIPRQLWLGLFVAAGFLALTIVAAVVHPGSVDRDKE